MQVQEISDDRRFRALGDAAAAPLQQRPAYGAAAAALGAGIARFEFRDGRTTVGTVQLLSRRIAGFRVTLATRGPVWAEPADGERQAAALRALRRAVPGLMLVTPGDAHARARHAGLVQLMTSGTVALLPLGDDMRARMHGKWRNRLRRAETLGLDIAETGLARLGWLFDADAEAQRRKGYRTLPRAFAEAWPDRTLGLVARRAGEEIAAMLFLRHGSTATYLVGWSGAAGRHASAHTLILWRAMERLRGDGVRQIDLGLIDTVNAPGLARFKLGAGAVPHLLGGTWLGW